VSSSFLEDTCPWCGAIVGSEGYVFVKGHYECVRCKRPVLDCCDGEVAQYNPNDPIIE